MDVLRRHNVRESGRPDGPPVVLAHGFGCDQNMWRLVTPSFERDHRVITFDHAGAGGALAEAYDVERHGRLDGYAQDVVDILRALDLREVTFVGHSVSSMIGVLAQIQEPERFAALVLVGPSPRYLDDPEAEPPYVGGFSAADINELLESLAANYLGWSAAMAPAIMGNGDRPELGQELTASFCRTDPVIAQRFAGVTFLSDNRAELAHVTCPTLVLQCSDDVIAPTSVGEFVHQQIPGSRYHLLQATGHCPNLSAPEETVAAIEPFLSDLARA